MEGPKRIYTSLGALSINPEAWKKHSNTDIEYIRADLVKELEEVSRIISEYINPNQVVFVKYGSRREIYERLQQALKALEG